MSLDRSWLEDKTLRRILRDLTVTHKGQKVEVSYSVGKLLRASGKLALACLEALEIDPEHTSAAPDPLGDAIALTESVLESLGELVNDGFQGSQLAEDLEGLADSLEKLAAQRIALRSTLVDALMTADVEIPSEDAEFEGSAS